MDELPWWCRTTSIGQCNPWKLPTPPQDIGHLWLWQKPTVNTSTSLCYALPCEAFAKKCDKSWFRFASTPRKLCVSTPCYHIAHVTTIQTRASSPANPAYWLENWPSSIAATQPIQSTTAPEQKLGANHLFSHLARPGQAQDHKSTPTKIIPNLGEAVWRASRTWDPTKVLKFL